MSTTTHTVERISTGDCVSAVRVHFALPTDVASAAGLDLRIEPPEASGRGCALVLSGVPGCAAQRVPLACEVDEDSVRAKFKVRLWLPWPRPRHLVPCLDPHTLSVCLPVPRRGSGVLCPSWRA